jgi:hypothetical protein
VKVTFFSFPYDVDHPVMADQFISIPTLLTLGSMKAFAIGGMAKWKDYADLNIILKDHYTIEEFPMKQ